MITLREIIVMHITRKFPNFHALRRNTHEFDYFHSRKKRTHIELKTELM